MHPIVECYPTESARDRTLVMEPVRIDVTTPSRALRRARSATASLDRLGRAARRRAARRRAASSSRARWSGGSTAQRLARGASRRRADPRARRRALQAAADRVARSTTRWSAPTPIARRRSSPSAAASSATWPASPRRPTCAASRSSTCRRRCWRRSTARSAARSASTIALGKNLIGAFYQPHAVVDRSVGARHAAAPRIPRRALRGDQVRHDVEPVAVRSRRHASARRSSRAQPRGADGRSSPSRAGSRPTWSRPTNAKPGCGGS